MTDRDSSDGAKSVTSAALSRLAEETELSVDDLSEVLVFDDEGAVGILPRGPKLGKTSTTKARTVASLITGARFGGLGERTTPLEVVRKACDDRGCYDQTNFKSYHIGKHPALGLRDNSLHIQPSRWLADFQAAIARARGLESDSK